LGDGNRASFGEHCRGFFLPHSACPSLCSRIFRRKARTDCDAGAPHVRLSILYWRSSADDGGAACVASLRRAGLCPNPVELINNSLGALVLSRSSRTSVESSLRCGLRWDVSACLADPASH